MTGEMFTVWTRNTSLVHLPSKRNTNTAITHGVVRARAENVLHMLQDTYGDVHAEIYPAGEKPVSATVGNAEAEDRAIAATAARTGMTAVDLRAVIEVYRDECRRVIKDG